MSPEMVLLLEFLDARRAKKGAQYCKKSLVGRMRARLAMSSANVTPIESMLSEGALKARTEAALILKRHCADCGRCELGRE